MIPLPPAIAEAIVKFGAEMSGYGASVATKQRLPEYECLKAQTALEAAISEALVAQRNKFGEEARRFASSYPPHSDGRNTFLMLADRLETMNVP